jgi:hypothetical protein
MLDMINMTFSDGERESVVSEFQKIGRNERSDLWR